MHGGVTGTDWHDTLDTQSLSVDAHSRHFGGMEATEHYHSSQLHVRTIRYILRYTQRNLGSPQAPANLYSFHIVFLPTLEICYRLSNHAPRTARLVSTGCTLPDTQQPGNKETAVAAPG